MPIRARVIYQYLKLVTFIAVLIWRGLFGDCCHGAKSGRLGWWARYHQGDYDRVRAVESRAVRGAAQSKMKALAFVALLALNSTAAGQDIIGQATVIDGDTIEIHLQRIRLWGIDAPESDQLGGADSELFRCGSAAASGLVDHSAGHVVLAKGHRSLPARCGVCLADGVDLARWLVQGWVRA